MNCNREGETMSKLFRCAALISVLLASATANAGMPNPGNSYQQCPVGSHAETFPNGNGFRCVPNHW
jgi:methionine synthase I (cobalamin-dependent)